ncbi:alpha/beta-hydrolase [Infundibulicybe gibba]|nr:alpha/beta-hydrolase [Infundibulicybe gibba]
MIELITEQLSVLPSSSYPLHVLATRYRNKHTSSKDGYTLIFLHAIGTHKETWDVAIRNLFELSCTRYVFTIRDAFSIECPNHGESAILNREVLQTQFSDTWHTREYSRAIHRFLTAGISCGAMIDFSQRKLVAVAHSFGAPAIFLMGELSPKIPWLSIIAIEAGIRPLHFKKSSEVLKRTQAWVWLRPEIWSSQEAAQMELSKAPIYRQWDPRVLALYVKHGLVPHPASALPEFHDFKAVVTAITKQQEIACFRSPGVREDGMKAYELTIRDTPVHLIWGAIDEMISSEIKEAISRPRMGASPASVRYIPNAGHLVVQQQPEAISKQIYEVISSFPAPVAQARALL